MECWKAEEGGWLESFVLVLEQRRMPFISQLPSNFTKIDFDWKAFHSNYVMEKLPLIV